MNALILHIRSWKPAKVLFYVCCVYTVGIIGFTLPVTRSLFHTLVPVNILGAALLAVLFHPRFSPSFWIFMVFCMLSGYLVELAGTRTGIIFGEYSYGETLGPKLAGVPPLIGVNWFMLAYACGVMTSGWKAPGILRAALAAGLMTAYDLILEPNAIQLGFWTWADGIIPARNFLAWFIVSFILQAGYLKAFPGKTQNPVAVGLYFIQFIFFLILYSLHKIWG